MSIWRKTEENNALRTLAEGILRRVYGEDAQFRPGQYEAIEATVRYQRTLVVQKTGWGKSLIYFLCTQIFRAQGRGLTLVVSPLLALMDNQAEMAKGLGLRCDVLNSSVKDRREVILKALVQDELDLLFITPETLFKEDVQRILPKLRIGLFVIDEAHCISDWGNDFRLEYGRLREVIRRLPSNVSVLATTATANDRVVSDLKKQLGHNVHVCRGPLSRESLHLQVLHLGNRVLRYAWLLENLPKLPGTGIIYCLTRRDCDYLSAFLNENHIPVRAYYSGTNREQENERAVRLFRENRIKAIVATVKLGMGYDKGDISFVIHYQMPSNIVLYYQQIGRAGRNIPDAYVFLMCGEEDLEINNYFIDTAFPSERETDAVLKAAGSKNGMTKSELEASVNIRRSRLEKTLEFLLNEGALRKDGANYYLTPRHYEYPEKHYAAITETRRREMEQMLELTQTDKCLLRVAVECLDDHTAQDCGHCANCLKADVFPYLELHEWTKQRAADFINRQLLTIQPRRVWPDRKRIEIPNQSGVCLSKYGDPGYGMLVKEGKYGQPPRFCDELVGKSAAVLKELAAQNGIDALTYVPSLRSDLVKDFAQRVARSANLRFLELLEKTPAPQQKDMENSAHQCQNAFDSFRAIQVQAPEKLILIDDVVDSGWTLTVCGCLLTERGCKEVFPFALADSSSS